MLRKLMMLTVAPVAAGAVMLGVLFPADATAAAPRVTHRAQAAPFTWTLTLTADPSVVFDGDPSTLTATTNADVGPTPYYIGIYDAVAGTWLAECPSGSTCSVDVFPSRPVVFPSPPRNIYDAVVGPFHVLPFGPGTLASASTSIGVRPPRPCPRCGTFCC
jgi:hypothetical protein